MRIASCARRTATSGLPSRTSTFALQLARPGALGGRTRRQGAWAHRTRCQHLASLETQTDTQQGAGPTWSTGSCRTRGAVSGRTCPRTDLVSAAVLLCCCAPHRCCALCAAVRCDTVRCSAVQHCAERCGAVRTGAVSAPAELVAAASADHVPAPANTPSPSVSAGRRRAEACTARVGVLPAVFLDAVLALGAGLA
eukprot:1769917-Rhodomonas_salina.2